MGYEIFLTYFISKLYSQFMRTVANVMGAVPFTDGRAVAEPLVDRVALEPIIANER